MGRDLVATACRKSSRVVSSSVAFGVEEEVVEDAGDDIVSGYTWSGCLTMLEDVG